MKKLKRPVYYMPDTRERLLPEDSRLIYRRGVHPTRGDSYVQVCAQVRGERFVRWSFFIYEDTSSQLQLEIDQMRGWMAFVEVPDIFAALAAKELAFRRVNDDLYTLDTVEQMLIEHGALKDEEE